MNAQLVIHLDNADGKLVWWAESPQVPGFTASADTLPELRGTIAEVLADLAEDLGEPVSFTSERLADPGVADARPASEPADQGKERASEGPPPARVRLPVMA